MLFVAHLRALKLPDFYLGDDVASAFLS
jgi:hypothetical protein